MTDKRTYRVTSPNILVQGVGLEVGSLIELTEAEAIARVNQVELVQVVETASETVVVPEAAAETETEAEDDEAPAPVPAPAAKPQVAAQGKK